MSAVLRIQNMIRSREPGTFFGGGIIAGLLLFLVWFAFVPSNRKAPADASASSDSAQLQAPTGANGEVLSSITGSDGIGGVSFGRADAQEAGGEENTLEGIADGDVPFTGEFGQVEPGSTTVGVQDGQPQEGYLEAYAEIDGVRVPNPPQPAVAEAVLQPWYVEIAREDGQVEVLQLNAQSAEHALSIVRDYRGNPQIVRGPSTQPLD